MNEQMIEAKVHAILCRLYGVGEDEIESDLNLFDAGLLDSFAVIELLMELEEAFDVPMRVEDIPRERIATPAKIAALVGEALA